MTRINVLPPEELYDQHLLIELRELPRMFTYIEKHTLKSNIYSGPLSYTMGAGHMKFFSDKAEYLFKRMFALCEESLKRGFKFNFDNETWLERYNSLPLWVKQDYSPTIEAMTINRDRIAEKVLLRPNFYRMNGLKI